MIPRKPDGASVTFPLLNSYGAQKWREWKTLDEPGGIRCQAPLTFKGPDSPAQGETSWGPEAGAAPGLEPRSCPIWP